MDLHKRIEALARLGDHLRHLPEEEKNYIRKKAKAHNGWFDSDSVELALKEATEYLKRQNLERWISRYDLPERNERPLTVGIVMAGNIPMVGFHDLLCVLITGNTIRAKLSAQDPFLLRYVAEKLTVIEPAFAPRIEFVDKLKDIDAIIATGSDNTSRYFEYYFGKYPHIIRKNRTSLAIITGQEHPGDFLNLGRDIFYYFGLGCRNISKIFVPEGFNFRSLIEPLKVFDHVMDNQKYANNYMYNRSIFLVNQAPHIDTGFCLLKESADLVSPTSVIYYQFYNRLNDVVDLFESLQDKIQCIVSANGSIAGTIPFGEAQKPSLWDYADNVDTVRFLASLG